MEIHRKQIGRDKSKFLVLTDADPKTHVLRGLLVDTRARTVGRVRSVPALLHAEAWLPMTEGDPTLDALVRLVPALRPFRGIEVRLSTGEIAWILWGQWSSVSHAAQVRLTQATQAIAVPAYEPDGDYFLAMQAVAALGGAVLDLPRAVAAPDEAY